MGAACVSQCSESDHCLTVDTNCMIRELWFGSIAGHFVQISMAICNAVQHRHLFGTCFNIQVVAKHLVSIYFMQDNLVVDLASIITSLHQSSWIFNSLTETSKFLGEEMKSIIFCFCWQPEWQTDSIFQKGFSFLHSSDIQRVSLD